MLISFLNTEILACPVVSGFQAEPNPVEVGEIVTFSAVITPKEDQTLVDWKLTVDGQEIMSGTGGGVQVDGVIFETSGIKSATLTGTWQDKDGKTHTGFIGDPDMKFTVYKVNIELFSNKTTIFGNKKHETTITAKLIPDQGVSSEIVSDREIEFTSTIGKCEPKKDTTVNGVATTKFIAENKTDSIQSATITATSTERTGSGSIDISVVNEEKYPKEFDTIHNGYNWIVARRNTLSSVLDDADAKNEYDKLDNSLKLFSKYLNITDADVYKQNAETFNTTLSALYTSIDTVLSKLEIYDNAVEELQKKPSTSTIAAVEQAVSNIDIDEINTLIASLESAISVGETLLSDEKRLKAAMDDINSGGIAVMTLTIQEAANNNEEIIIQLKSTKDGLKGIRDKALAVKDFETIKTEKKREMVNNALAGQRYTVGTWKYIWDDETLKKFVIPYTTTIDDYTDAQQKQMLDWISRSLEYIEWVRANTIPLGAKNS
jgi:hypothetical protein